MKHSDLPWYHKRIIGIAGPAGSGKDTFADEIQKQVGLAETTKLALSATLKEAVKIIYSFTHDQLYTKKKEKVDPYWGVSPRQVLQLIGTEVARTLDADIWLKSFHKRMMEMEYGREHQTLTIIPDVRFPNEADWVRKHGILWHVTGRAGHLDSDHATEVGLPISNCDLIVDNSGSLWHVEYDVRAALLLSWEFIHAPT